MSTPTIAVTPATPAAAQQVSTRRGGNSRSEAGAGESFARSLDRAGDDLDRAEKPVGRRGPATPREQGPSSVTRRPERTERGGGRGCTAPSATAADATAPDEEKAEAARVADPTLLGMLPPFPVAITPPTGGPTTTAVADTATAPAPIAPLAPATAPPSTITSPPTATAATPVPDGVAGTTTVNPPPPPATPAVMTAATAGIPAPPGTTPTTAPDAPPPAQAPTAPAGATPTATAASPEPTTPTTTAVAQPGQNPTGQDQSGQGPTGQQDGRSGGRQNGGEQPAPARTAGPVTAEVRSGFTVPANPTAVPATTAAVVPPTTAAAAEAAGPAAAPTVPGVVTAPATATPVAATAPTVPVTSTPPAPLPLANPLAFAQGIAGRLGALPPTVDTVQRMSVEVNPLGLGPVTVTAEVSDGALHVQLAGSSEAARHALRGAVADLQRELGSTSYTSTTVDVSTDSPAPQPDQRQTNGGEFGGRGNSGSAGNPGGDRRGEGHGPGQRLGGLFDAVGEGRARQRAAAATAAGRVDLRA